MQAWCADQTGGWKKSQCKRRLSLRMSTKATENQNNKCDNDDVTVWITGFYDTVSKPWVPGEIRWN